MTASTPQTSLVNHLELGDRIRQIFLEEADRVTQLLGDTPPSQLLGQTEFLLRDLLHHAGARALEAALDEGKKGGTKVPA